MSKRFKSNPWMGSYYGAKYRCNNISYKSYHRYGGRGIKFLLTQDMIKELWFRDKAYNMEKPTLDREDNNGHYEFNNCSFIENRENAIKDKRKRVLQFDLHGNFIQAWISTREIERCLNIDHSSVYRVCLKRRKSAGGFVWKYEHIVKGYIGYEGNNPACNHVNPEADIQFTRI